MYQSTCSTHPDCVFFAGLGLVRGAEFATHVYTNPRDGACGMSWDWVTIGKEAKKGNNTTTSST